MNVMWDVPFARGTGGWRSAARRLAGDRHQHDAQRPAADGVRAEQPLALAVVAVDRADLRSRSARSRAGPHAPRAPCSAVRISGSIRRRSCCSPQGTLGNSARGAFRGPNLRTVDVAAMKRVPARRRARALELRLEVFNLFNRANFGNPTLIAFAGVAPTEAPLASFGRIRSTVTSARQMQLGLRIAF